ncbi:MAG: hypothetical protein H6837_11260 [Planctomycetes bacterium]|nr:hypothetical protein [Planctomycetota bacterium]
MPRPPSFVTLVLICASACQGVHSQEKKPDPLRAAVEGYEARLNQLEQTLAKAREQGTAKLESALRERNANELRQAQERFRDTEKQLRSDLHRAESQLKDTHRSLQAAQAEARHSADQMRQMRDALARAEQQSVGLNSRIAELERSWQDKLRAAQQALGAAREDAERSRHHVQNLNQTAISLKRQLAERARSSEQTAERQSIELAKARNEAARAKEQVDRAKVEIDRMHHGEQQGRQAMAHLEQELARVRSQADQATRELERTRKELAATRRRAEEQGERRAQGAAGARRVIATQAPAVPPTGVPVLLTPPNAPPATGPLPGVNVQNQGGTVIIYQHGATAAPVPPGSGQPAAPRRARRPATRRTSTPASKSATSEHGDVPQPRRTISLPTKRIHI